MELKIYMFFKLAVGSLAIMLKIARHEIKAKEGDLIGVRLDIDSGDWPIIGNPDKGDLLMPLFKYRDNILDIYSARIHPEDLSRDIREYKIVDGAVVADANSLGVVAF